MSLSPTNTSIMYGFFILAIVLLALELLIAKRYFMLTAVSSAIAGFLQWLFPHIEFTTQIIVFIVLTILFFLIHYKRQKNPIDNHDFRGKSFIGKTFPLASRIKKGKGKIFINNAYWYVQCNKPLKKGDLVKVTRSHGTILEVTTND